MANLIDKTYFKGFIKLATNNPNTVILLDEVITDVEAQVLPLVTYDVADEDLIKVMLANFTYFVFTGDEIDINTSLGNVKTAVENGEKIVNKRKRVRAYNLAVDTFNIYSSECYLEYVNSLGI